jgi:hypothetical protein
VFVGLNFVSVSWFSNIFFCEGPRSRYYRPTAAWGLLCNPVMKMISFFFSFFLVMEHRWNEIDRGKPKYSGGKTCPSATLSTTKPTWTDPGSNPGLRGERPATNRLSHDTAFWSFTRSHPVENSLWKRLRTCRKTDYRMNYLLIYTHTYIYIFFFLFFLWLDSPWGPRPRHFTTLHDHTQTHHTR